MRAPVALLALGPLLLAIGAAGGHAGPAAAVLRAQPPSGCTAAATKSLVHEFVRDYARGRVAAIDRLWAPAARFQWFSTRPPGARLGARAYDRSTLAGYFRARTIAHERLQLLQLGAGYDRHRGIVNFGGRLVRSADDISRLRPQDFKGAADCFSGRPLLIVWSM